MISPPISDIDVAVDIAQQTAIDINGDVAIITILPHMEYRVVPVVELCDVGKPEGWLDTYKRWQLLFIYDPTELLYTWGK